VQYDKTGVSTALNAVLELYAGKLARTVLRGPRFREEMRLPSARASRRRPCSRPNAQRLRLAGKRETAVQASPARAGARGAPHALSHSATDAIARKMPLEVVQRLLEHLSLSTPSTSTGVERKRSIEKGATVASVVS